MTNLYYATISILFGILIYIVCSKVINTIIKIKITAIETSKKKTVASLIKNIIKYIIFIAIIVIILRIYNFDTSTIIASVGIIGAVIGLAFQDLLKDLITGIFIIVEDQYRMDEDVLIDGFRGKIIFLGLKSTKIKSINGEIKIIPNGKILNVVNYSREKTKLVVKLTTSVENNSDDIIKLIDIICTKAIEQKENKKCEYSGIGKVSNNNITYLMDLTTKLKYQQNIEKELNKIILLTFRDEKNNLEKREVEVTYE